MKRLIGIVLFLLMIAGAVTVSAQDPDVQICGSMVLSPGYDSACFVSQVMDLEVCYTAGPDGAPPARWRHAVVEAANPGSQNRIASRADYIRHGADVLCFEDARWGDWNEWRAHGDVEELHIEGLAEYSADGSRRFYLLAVQVEDANGSRSTELSYSTSVQNFAVRGTAAPELTVREDYLGERVFTQTSATAHADVGGGLVMVFRWLGSADAYGGDIDSYRWGWDLDDPDDPMEPGWAVSPGLDPEHLTTGAVSFSSGIHVLTIDCRDTAGHLTRARWVITVVPVPDPSMQLPLLLVDDVPDHGGMGWPDQSGILRSNDVFRDAFWENALDPVVGWDPVRDVYDTTDDRSFSYRDLVDYRAVVWSTVRNTGTMIATEFGGIDPAPNWLELYQRTAGNLFLVGGVENFNGWAYLHPDMVRPLIYTSSEPPVTCGGQEYAMSYGTTVDFDGNEIVTGMLTYSYRALGLTVRDLVSGGPTLPCSAGVVMQDRNRVCTSPKGVVIDPVFRSGSGLISSIPDTTMTWSVIDHADTGELDIAWSFGYSDEVFDWNATLRDTDWEPQTLPDGSPVVEVMLRSMPRYDWVRDQNDASWPDFDPVEVCGGGVFLDPVGPGSPGQTGMSGAPLGVLTRATSATKPGGRPDVLWGFDPYRFEPEAMTSLIRWTLGAQFGLQVEGLVPIEPDPDPAPMLPVATTLRRCRPNPFNPSTTLSFDLARPGAVTLRVVDVRGRHVATLVDEPKPAGTHEARWSGRDDAGQEVPTGVYFAQLITEEGRETSRMLLLK